LAGMDGVVRHLNTNAGDLVSIVFVRPLHRVPLTASAPTPAATTPAPVFSAVPEVKPQPTAPPAQVLSPPAAAPVVQAKAEPVEEKRREDPGLQVHVPTEESEQHETQQEAISFLAVAGYGSAEQEEEAAPAQQEAPAPLATPKKPPTPRVGIVEAVTALEPDEAYAVPTEEAMIAEGEAPDEPQPTLAGITEEPEPVAAPAAVTKQPEPTPAPVVVETPAAAAGPGYKREEKVHEKKQSKEFIVVKVKGVLSQADKERRKKLQRTGVKLGALKSKLSNFEAAAKANSATSKPKLATLTRAQVTMAQQGVGVQKF